ncbi:AbrB/MazE/SpoVT family DNA-binding domain-containing protein [Halobellus inordinatus]|uniref:AbrB/MazE/SpoVT family DNA-binding domain-containing protein n=1 Tax=Halobellus inordinatus TaxID=1126236 RepID=UPI00210BE146|nr:AbrB/MazE/SpoVT family DNA-binding domain-containing protein [Halobellus inordinatus]
MSTETGASKKGLEEDIQKPVRVAGGDSYRIVIPKEAVRQLDIKPKETLFVEGEEGESSLTVRKASEIFRSD